MIIIYGYRGHTNRILIMIITRRRKRKKKKNNNDSNMRVPLGLKVREAVQFLCLCLG